jgi:hypothetical protein
MAKYNWRQKRGPKHIDIKWNNDVWNSEATITTIGTRRYNVEWNTMPSTTLPNQEDSTWTEGTLTSGIISCGCLVAAEDFGQVGFASASVPSGDLAQIPEVTLNNRTYDFRGISADSVIIDEVA